MSSDAAQLSISRSVVATPRSTAGATQYRIFLTGSGIADRAKSFLRDNGCVIETGSASDTPAVLASKLSAFDPDALIVRQGIISGEVQHAGPGLKVI